MSVCDKIPRFGFDDIVIIMFFAFVGGYFVGAIFYGHRMEEIYGTTWLMITSGTVASGGAMTLIIADLIKEFIEGVDPYELISKCGMFSRMPEERRLIEAHELAVNRAYSLFVDFFAYWILIGVANSILLLYGIPHWLTTVSIGVFSIAAFLSFVLWIISYLRYRDYSKKLFLLQLNKGKAEVAIKI